MRKSLIGLLVLGMAVAAVFMGHTVRATETKATGGSNWYVIQTTHTGPECLAALDAMNKNKLLTKTYFGCMVGDHRGWTILQAASSQDAINMIPDNQRANAQLVQVTQFTPKQLQEIHSK